MSGVNVAAAAAACATPKASLYSCLQPGSEVRAALVLLLQPLKIATENTSQGEGRRTGRGGHTRRGGGLERPTVTLPSLSRHRGCKSQQLRHTPGTEVDRITAAQV